MSPKYNHIIHLKNIDTRVIIAVRRSHLAKYWHWKSYKKIDKKVCEYQKVMEIYTANTLRLQEDHIVIR